MEGPYEKTKKTMEKIYRDAEPNQDIAYLKNYTNAPYAELALRLQRNGIHLTVQYFSIYSAGIYCIMV